MPEGGSTLICARPCRQRHLLVCACVDICTKHCLFLHSWLGIGAIVGHELLGQAPQPITVFCSHACPCAANGALVWPRAAWPNIPANDSFQSPRNALVCNQRRAGVTRSRAAAPSQQLSFLFGHVLVQQPAQLHGQGPRG